MPTKHRLIISKVLQFTFIFMALAGFSIMMTGCGGVGETEGEAGKVIITANNGAQEGEDKRLEEQRQVRQLFSEKYPGAELRYDAWQFSPESFMARMAGDTATDIIGLFATEATVVIEKQLAADITNKVKSWELYPYVNKEVLEPITYEGKIYGLPVGGVVGSYVMTLFYNKELFKEAGIEQPPQTWEEFVDVAKKLTDREKGQAGFGILGEKSSSGWHFLNWGWQAGGEFEVKKDGKWVAAFDSPEVITALQFIKDLRWKHDVLQEDVLSDNDDLFEYFSSGRIAMALFTPEYLVHLIEKYEMPYEKIGIALLPAGPGGRANQMGGAYNIINPIISEEKKEWAFKAMLFDYDLETIELKCKIMNEQGRIFGFGTIPVFHGEYQEKVEAIIDKYRTVPGQDELMKEAAKYIKPEPPYYCQQLYGEILGPCVQAVLTREDADPNALLERAAEEFQADYLDKLTLKK